MENEKLIERQKWFVNLKVGQFIHFNSATQQFNSTKLDDWEYTVENNNAKRLYPFNPIDWNPSKLDCDLWAKTALSLGAKFAALTSKHHEGFCLWDTKTTEHSIKNATYKVDVVREYINAYKKVGIEAGLYFSMLDLTHKIGKNKCTKEDVLYTKAQLKELLTNYGDIPFLIIDGWQAHWGGPSYANMPFEEIDSLVKSINPNCLLINLSCETSLKHTDIVFYENAAGQEVEDNFNGPGASGHILNNTWFNKEADASSLLKSVEWASDKIIDMNNKNVSFLLNLSPNKDGLVDDNMITRFKEIGDNLKGKLPKAIKNIPDNWLRK